MRTDCPDGPGSGVGEMIVITEDQSAKLIDHTLAYTAVHEALVSAAEDASIFPVVVGHGRSKADIFAVKSASARGTTGLKIGTFWPGNAERGLPRHGSTIVLIDPDTGRIKAVIEASLANAYRTAAADAVATDALARADASVLALFGTGHQALYEACALARIRALDRILVVGRDAAKAAAFSRELAGRGLPAIPASPRDACMEADLIVTATTATAPLFDAAWVQPGTHIASMGSDVRGKQELPGELFARARLFCDLPSQSVVVGEFQHAPPGTPLFAIGDVLAGRVPGRTETAEITIFDSSGLSVQDLFIGEAILAAHLHPAH